MKGNRTISTKGEIKKTGWTDFNQARFYMF